MSSRRVNPYLIKVNRSYTASELAARLGAHKNTVRQWQREGLSALDSGRPAIFHGAAVRAFLLKRNATRKRPCSPGTLYCFRCREPQAPASGTVEFFALTRSTGNLRASCGACGTTMHRRARLTELASVMPDISIAIREAPRRLVGSPSPSLNCDTGKAS